MNERELTDGRYLGDGAYASYDGYQFWLAANDHRNKLVALEPTVLILLLEYVRDVYAHYGAEQQLSNFKDALGDN